MKDTAGSRKSAETEAKLDPRAPNATTRADVHKKLGDSLDDIMMELRHHHADLDAKAPTGDVTVEFVVREEPEEPEDPGGGRGAEELDVDSKQPTESPQGLTFGLRDNPPAHIMFIYAIQVKFMQVFF